MRSKASQFISLGKRSPQIRRDQAANFCQEVMYKGIHRCMSLRSSINPANVNDLSAKREQDNYLDLPNLWSSTKPPESELLYYDGAGRVD